MNHVTRPDEFAIRWTSPSPRVRPPDATLGDPSHHGTAFATQTDRDQRQFCWFKGTRLSQLRSLSPLSLFVMLASPIRVIMLYLPTWLLAAFSVATNANMVSHATTPSGDMHRQPFQTHSSFSCYSAAARAAAPCDPIGLLCAYPDPQSMCRYSQLFEPCSSSCCSIVVMPERSRSVYNWITCCRSYL